MTAFSNGTEFDAWSANWCHECKRDELGGAPEGTYCDILSTVMVLNERPEEWTAGADDYSDRYHCTKFVRS